MIKAVIFDFFGVIGISTYQLIAEKIDVNSDDVRYKISDLHKALDNGFITQEEFLHNYAELASLAYDDFLKIYHDASARFAVSDKLIECIYELKKDNYKIGLLTNVNEEAFKEFVQPVVDKDLFDVVMPSFETQLVKPSEAAFLEMAKKLQVSPSDCLMVDDLVANCQAAEACGMKSIVFVNFFDFKRQFDRLMKG